MEFVSKSWIEFGPIAGLVLRAILLSLQGILLLIAFIVVRRWYRGRYFQRLNQRTFALRSQWDDIVSGRIPASAWRLKTLDCEIVEAILLDTIEVASPEQMPPLLHCLRSSGLLDLRIYQARTGSGWKRRTALVALGRTRAPEAVPALAEGLDSASAEDRMAAIRGLGRTGLIEAAGAILSQLVWGELKVPEHALKNALANTCRSSPSVLANYLNQSRGKTRELLARVLSEMAGPELVNELLPLAADPLAEVRAAAARALANTSLEIALPALSILVRDPEWFVRLRAVVALGSLDGRGRIKPLLHGLCDSNRYVRQRSAWVLAGMKPESHEILQQVVDTEDSYALQALISEMERSGEIENVIEALDRPSDDPSTQAALVQALDRGRQQLAKAAAAKASGGQR
jgi:HEAT repeat protein